VNEVSIPCKSLTFSLSPPESSIKISIKNGRRLLPWPSSAAPVSCRYSTNHSGTPWQCCFSGCTPCLDYIQRTIDNGGTVRSARQFENGNFRRRAEADGETNGADAAIDVELPAWLFVPSARVGVAS
jgi:hypothetical protein